MTTLAKILDKLDLNSINNSMSESFPELKHILRTLFLIYNTMSRKQQAMETMCILAMRVIKSPIAFHLAETDNRGVGMFFAHMTE